MKTNKILMAMALPALFAACTAEEFEQVAVQQDNLAGRALLDPSFAINVAEGVESRFAWENMVWKYEAGDQFGAAVVDVKELGTIEDGQMLGNYIFAKNDEGEWKTTSQMTEGTYIYYSFDGFEKKNSRSPLTFDFTGQKANLAKADAELNKYENQLFISPFYKLVPEYSDKKLPLTFYSYAGVAAFPITNKSGQDLKITQIVLRSDAEMIVKGAVKPSALSAATYEYYADSAKYIPSAAATYLANAKKNGTAVDAETVASYYTAASEDLYLETAAQELAKDGKKSNYITLDCQNYLLKDGSSKVAYMMVPAGIDNLTVEIMVVDEEGEAWSIYVAESESEFDYTFGADEEAIIVDDMNSIITKRDKTNAIFGKTTDNKSMKYIKILEENLCENSGYYVDSKAALLELLDGNLGSIDVHNSGDWAIDAEIVDAILNYTGASIKFSNPIEMKSTAELTAEEKLALKKVTFTELTIVGTEYAADGETVTFEGTTADLANVTVTEKLTIEEGATVVINGGDYAEIVNDGTLTLKGGKFGKITNNGTMTVEAAVAATRATPVDNITEIENTGALTIKGIDRKVTLKEGSVSYEAANIDGVTGVDAMTVKKLTVARNLTKAASITIGAKVTWELSADITDAYAASLNTNNTAVSTGLDLTVNAEGKVVAAKRLRVADLTNNGSIDVTSLTVYGEATNNKTIKVSDQMYLGNYNGHVIKPSLTNNGDIYGNVTLESKAEVEAVEGSSMTIKALDTTPRVNNTDGGNVQIATGSETCAVYYEYEDCNLMDFVNLEYNLFNINTIVVTGKFTFDAKDLAQAPTDFNPANYFNATSSGTLFGSKVRNIEFKDGSELYWAAGNMTGVGFANIFVEGDVTIKGWSKDQSKMYLGKGVQVNLALNSELTVSNIYVATGNDEIVSGATEAKIVCVTTGKTTDDEYGKLVVNQNALVENVNIDSNATAE